MPTIVTLETFDAWARDQINADAPLKIAALDAAEQWVAHETGRSWVIATGTPSSRVFRPRECADLLHIDDCVSIASVTENGRTLTSGTDFIAEPLNGRNQAGAVVPFNALRRIGYYWYVDRMKATVTVSADWGWSSVPYEVTEAVKYVAKAILDGRNIVGGTLAVSEVGAVRESDAKVARDMIAHFKSVKRAGWVR